VNESVQPELKSGKPSDDQYEQYSDREDRLFHWEEPVLDDAVCPAHKAFGGVISPGTPQKPSFLSPS
jgi:hypothetical protein